MQIRKIIYCFTLLFSYFLCKGQVTIMGNDPAYIKWYNIKSQNYKVIYPKGLDSLAKEYAKQLEINRLKVGTNLGMLPRENYTQILSVILHPYTTMANGSMLLAPRRMDLYTTAESSNTLPNPWINHLTLHESRHSAQLQFTRKKWLKPLYYLFGDMALGAVTGIYPSMILLEGDAVVAETSLTKAGRGRNATFLEFYHPAFDSGDLRNWQRWKYGSAKYYSPNHYALGYLTIAGVRSIYDYPDFMKIYFDRIKSNPFRFFNLKKTIKLKSKKNLENSWKEVVETYKKQWEVYDKSRYPFTKMQLISAKPRRYTKYKHIILANNRLFAIKKSIIEPSSIVSINTNFSKKVNKIKSFSSFSSNFSYDKIHNRLYFSDYIRNKRWSLSSYSSIKYIDLYTKKIHSFQKGRYFYPKFYKNRIYCTELMLKGGSAIVIFNSRNAKIIDKFIAPDSLQFNNNLIIRDSIFVLCLSNEGMSLQKIMGKNKKGKAILKTILDPQFAQIKNLQSYNENKILFISDRNGVNELYSLNTDTKEVRQITNTKYGIQEAIFDRDSLICTSLAPASNPEYHNYGYQLYKIANKDIYNKKVDFYTRYKPPFAETISKQDSAIRQKTDNKVVVKISKAKRYYKLTHLFKIHSWTPFYFNSDLLSNLSFDIKSENIRPGVMLMLQNKLATAYGSVGYALLPKNNIGKFEHLFRLKYTYTGFYPVIDFDFSLSTRDNQQFFRVIYLNQKKLDNKLSSNGKLKENRQKFSISTNISTYIPFNFSSNGWNRGVIPLLSLNISNNFINTSILKFSGFQGKNFKIKIEEKGKNIPITKLKASLSAYIIREKAKEQYYPSWGINAQIIYNHYPFLSNFFSPSLSTYIYAYLPGFLKEQGFKLSYSNQIFLSNNYSFNSPVINSLPRGFKHSFPIMQRLLTENNTLHKFHIDYVIPIYVGDIWYFAPVVYIKNFVLKPYADFSLIKKDYLYSVGSEFSIKTANLLFYPFDCEIGLSLCYNGGSLFNKIPKIKNKRLGLNLIFRTNF